MCVFNSDFDGIPSRVIAYVSIQDLSEMSYASVVGLIHALEVGTARAVAWLCWFVEEVLLFLYGLPCMALLICGRETAVSLWTSLVFLDTRRQFLAHRVSKDMLEALHENGRFCTDPISLC